MKMTRLRGDGGLKGIQIDLVLSICPLYEHILLLDEVKILRHVQEGAVSRRLDQHAFPRADKGICRQVEASHHAGEQHHTLR